jgi:hypothetical protein
MEYTDKRGNAATGEVWSPGPLAGTVWVLPYSGAPSIEARVVNVRKRVEVTFVLPHFAGRNTHFSDQVAYLNAMHYAPRLPDTQWRAALGYNPRDVVQHGNVLPLPMAA